MGEGKNYHVWTLIVVFLLGVIITGGLVIWTRYNPGQEIKISVLAEEGLPAEIYIMGEVNNPGLYPLRTDDNFQDIVRSAGGVTDNADLGQLKLYVPGVGTVESPQKININRAELWLLQALPGIGEFRARAIVGHREKNGLFRNTRDLLKVEGIGAATYEQIKDMVTVIE